MPPAPTSSSSRSATHSAAAAASNRETTGCAALKYLARYRWSAAVPSSRRVSARCSATQAEYSRYAVNLAGGFASATGFRGVLVPPASQQQAHVVSVVSRGWMRRYPLVERGSGLAAACRLDGGVTGRLRLEAVDVVPALGFARELGKVAPASVFALLESCRVRGLWRWSGPGWCERGCGRGRVRRVEAPFDRGSEKQGRDKADDRDPGDDEGVFADRLPRVRSVSPPSHNGAKLPHSVEMKTLGGVSIESR